ncbi:phenylacetate--CoA ligase family protein [Pyxidicoccus fallax]|uniref:Phenylacetate--CoA ligase family protein n=1 Tax=Pyxidicoccus fallax TaxID=394095 RepID=A0A848LBS7_9BACT|nr:AMP-binding protein [Pyxidicoccus fallax]NMO15936.1 phenylacetate--CoA ligase family protein [Pyxidicoccus fallax]NPC79332.1 phenylacetate--CoA ligase family protein [Pyxidicoccus fallax]
MATQERLERINQVLRHARGADFYKERLPATPLRTWEEFQRLPFTTKEDLRRQSPHGMVCVPRQELLQYHESSATTGAPVSVWYSGKDLAEIQARFSEWGVGFMPGDRVLIRFPYALSTIGHFVHAAAQHKRACVIPADSRTSITPLPRVVELMRKLQVTVLATISLSAVMIAEAAEMAGFEPRRDFPHLRAICSAGEPLTQARRKLLEEIWGVPVYDNYGMTETGPQAMDCRVQQLHPWQGHFCMEVLDERLEKEVAPGETGYLVVTSLTPRASPVIRYLTGDRVQRMERPCECGQSSTLRVRGRVEDVLWSQGRPLDLWELEEIVSQLPGRRFWRVASAPDGRLHFVVEQERDGDSLRPALVSRLEAHHGVRMKVDLVPKGTLYDRNEPVSFGMAGKPIYVCTPQSMPEVRA